VNPHFLFNNLNVLSSLVMLENPEANKFIEEFAKVYRHILSSQQEELILLQTELDFIEPYVYLLKKRFPQSIHINIDVPKVFASYFILPAALQMLMENAIKHNIASRSRPLEIKIYIDEKNNLAVYNKLQLKIPDGQSTNVGLNNISQRYDIITGKKIEIIKTADSFSVTLPLIPVNK
ncbi:MAG: histidine kinase, partial [Parafilimonas sp.]